MTEQSITKKRVTMINAVAAGILDDGTVVTHVHNAVDYVREDHLEAYLAALGGKWDSVSVSDEYDAGPGRYAGATWVPDTLEHEEAGWFYPADAGHPLAGQVPEGISAAGYTVKESPEMAIQTVLGRTNMATAYSTTIGKFGALTTTAPSSTTGTEVTGGSPAYARIAPSWGTAATSAITATGMAFNVPSGTTVVGFEFFDASTAGNYLDGVGITSQVFSSQGTYTITPTYTQS